MDTSDTRKTVTVFGATGVAGHACVEELIATGTFRPQVLVRQPGQQEKTSTGVVKTSDEKERIYDDWARRGVTLKPVDATDHLSLIAALQGTDYLVSCVSFYATESQYPLIWAAKEAGVERFVPSEFGFNYEMEQHWPTDTIHRTHARQKAFLRRVIELAGLDFTIVPAGLWPEYYMVEPVYVMGDGSQKFSWSTGADAGRILPHVLAHPASRNAICPVAATAYCSWDELLSAREELLGREVERRYLDSAAWKAAYAAQKPGLLQLLMAIGIAATECPDGYPLWANWNGKFLPEFAGTPLPELFEKTIEPFATATRAALIASGEILT
ncbi:MAG: NmrA family NAD(P)-binding protein [Nocardioides sp.]